MYELLQGRSDLRILPPRSGESMSSFDRRRLQIAHTSCHLDFSHPTQCFRRLVGTRTHFCSETRLTRESRTCGEFLELQLRDVALRLSNHVTLWINLVRERGRTPSWYVSGEPRIGIVKLAMSSFVSSILATGLSVLESTGSHTLKQKTCTSGAGGSTNPGRPHKFRVSGCALVPCFIGKH